MTGNCSGCRKGCKCFHCGFQSLVRRERDKCTCHAGKSHKINPHALDHCIAGHVSAEPAHRRLLDKIGKKPLLDLGMRLGEGTGAAIAAGVVKAAVLTHSQMATFDEAGIKI
ncbi:nicotinate-nucleotide--dimethylbenzimidazole phosphoribosyltransferase [Bartonella sp. M0176]|nr:nicotinate-nucleotide--dimethylbenzimidazole phosphoribosyltransferase [Bartonella sp. P0291]MBH9998047.1 nicotinate-nucleotide--dimethylbenzimidazole phosphoribosyltransferase [Bartonella sp. M0192]MBI0000205.1 nicotinate-nucleotide--dimethylbenzimidazole phosphoribosyltransferase [Bartonella sp. M0191]MBI0008021.1 nicotinate-nucleotide--dimethylbenzimidazole phosphoribosyltransferase [Bartonella sp. M0193]MBI0011498.1 nicotinate-nucleotide--dimethylbenzimidazole phosphoribosyltransferase [